MLAGLNYSLSPWVFQFPSNGKVYSKDGKGTKSIVWKCVSIPFKRESVFKEKRRAVSSTPRSLVSIPFKRESVFKVIFSLTANAQIGTFVSIPFKRESVFKGKPTER